MGLMYKNEGGILALYRGIIPTVAGVAPYVSVDYYVISFFIDNILTNQFKGRPELHDI